MAKKKPKSSIEFITENFTPSQVEAIEREMKKLKNKKGGKFKGIKKKLF